MKNGKKNGWIFSEVKIVLGNPRYIMRITSRDALLRTILYFVLLSRFIIYVFYLQELLHYCPPGYPTFFRPLITILASLRRIA